MSLITGEDVRLFRDSGQRFVDQVLNRRERDAFAAFWRGRADEVCIRECHRHGGCVSGQRLADIRRGGQYSALRDGHVRGDFEHPYCRACTDWPAVGWRAMPQVG